MPIPLTRSTNARVDSMWLVSFGGCLNKLPAFILRRLNKQFLVVTEWFDFAKRPLTRIHCYPYSMGIGLIVLSGFITSSGCTRTFLDSVQQYQYAPYHHKFFHPLQYATDPVAPQTLRVIGYGTLSNDKKQSKSQRRLIAMRASRLDAYRALAERVYGLRLEGSTSVKDMVVEDDHFKSFIEASLHGARIVSTDIMEDGSVQTVVEMIIDHGFRNCLETAGHHRFLVDCRIPLGGQRPLPAQYIPTELPAPSSEKRATVNTDGQTSFYQIE